MQQGTLSHTWHTQSRKSSVKWAASMPMQRRSVSQQTPGSLTGRPPSGPPNTPFWHMQHTFHTHQGEQPTGGQIQTWPATSPRSGRPYSGTHSPSMAAPPPPHLRSGCPPLEVAMSQPAPGTPIGRQLSGYSATPPTHLTHISHSRRSEAHRRAIQIQWQHGHGLVCHIGAHISHHREQPHRTDAWWQGGIMASQPHLSPLLAIPPPCFSSIVAAIVTTCERRDCHHHHHHHHQGRAHHSGTVANVLTSPRF